jgi:hypothetical protein
VWASISPQIECVRELRNNVGFHITRDAAKYFATRWKFDQNKTSISQAISDFLELARELLEREDEALEDIKNEILEISEKIERRVPQLRAEWICKILFK